MPSALTRAVGARLNSSAVLAAMYEAEQIAKALHLAYWLADQAPMHAAYHMADAKERIAALSNHSGNFYFPVDAEPPAPSGDADPYAESRIDAADIGDA